MNKENLTETGIPVSVTLNETLEAEDGNKPSYDKHRFLTIALLSIAVAVAISLVAKFLVFLINFVTNVSFYGHASINASSPANNHLGLWVIVIPAMGGIVVGLMAVYGSKAIRGHGIPEAMEQILTNQSKIKPSVMYLKPLSSAISIGTGGPFGAEGPIIATGGALGSTFGQIIKITHNERKILLAAGATAGMSAIFGSPIAAIFLAIELLLFEFSPRSFIPVALACITGAAGHHFLFEGGYVFDPGVIIKSPSNTALFIYSAMGIVIGFLSVLVTKIVYFIEDAFEHLPVHWALWPAIGGVAVGVIGYFYPRTLGVGYNNITDVLSGSLTVQLLISLCSMKFLSWAISLGSGTSGGTLAPLLTIGGAAGSLLGIVVSHWFPSAGISIPLAGIVGMSAMFAGASRAFLTSIIFALETTGQSNALLALLGSCTASYFVSFFIMENTIMTEKIARRGVKAPHSYEPDLLEKMNVEDAIKDNGLIICEDNTVEEAREWLTQEEDHSNYFIISNSKGEYIGILSSSTLFNHSQDPLATIGTLVKRKNIYIKNDESLRAAVGVMASENIDVLPVVVNGDKKIIGVLSYLDIIATYKHHIDEKENKKTHISLKRHGLKLLLHGQRIAYGMKSNKKE
ncbi:MAG: chloride channel protein [Candidatus Dadabacteria bacterium]